MIKSIWLTTCIFSCVTVLAQEIDFDTSIAKTIIHPPSKSGGCEIEPAEFDGRNALRIDFNCNECTHCEFVFAPKNQIMLQDPVRKIVIKADVFLPGGNKASRLCLRLMDKSGSEVFQYRKNLPSDIKGWTTITYEINTEGKQPESWAQGDAGNRLLDWPVKLLGFSVGGFEKNPEGAGFIGLGKIKIIMEDKK